MAFDHIAAARLVPGKTVELKLNMLPGCPIVHVQHLGETNSSYWSDLIARADGKKMAMGAQKRTVAVIREERAKNRKTLAAHGIRHLEAKHSDGKPATDADIPEFVDALPDDVFDLVWHFAFNEANFRERPIDGDAKELAEK